MALQFKVGNGEFGEVYHLVTAAHLLQKKGEKLAICFEDFKAGEELFNFLSVERAEYRSDADAQHLGETANIIFDHFYPDCLENLAKSIMVAARKAHWSFPYPRLAFTNPKLIIWQRGKEWMPHRNSSRRLLEQLVGLCARHKTIPVVLGEEPEGITGAEELGRFFENNFFGSGLSIPKQLWFFDQLFCSYGAIAQVGMMSGAMDGPAIFFRHKTVFLARHRDATPRMQKVWIVVPNLIWQPIEYEGRFQELTDAQLQILEQNLWC